MTKASRDTVGSPDCFVISSQSLNQALKSANQQAQIAERIFSPQNWLKKNDSVNSEALVASTMVDMMEGMSSIGGKNIKELLNVSPDQFELRWKAD
jgi:hypothetical protein